MKKVIQKLTDWRDIWANSQPFAEFSVNRRPYTFGDFYRLAARAVVADGGTFNEFHDFLSFPPSITGRGWIEMSKDEIYKNIWK